MYVYHVTLCSSRDCHVTYICCPCAVYEDESAGARAEVILVTSTPEPPSQTPTGDDLYGDILSRHVTAGSKWGRDSAASSLSSDSGNQDSLSNEEFILGTLSVPPEISWVAMDGKVEKIVVVSVVVDRTVGGAKGGLSVM